MKQKVFSFMKPTTTSKIPSAGIARTLAQVTGAELCWGDSVAAEPLDVLFLVNGAFAFCKCLEAVGAAVQQAKRVVWVQNDYTIVPPKPESNAESPFRAAFRLRAEAGGAPMDYWTTIRENATLTPGSAYVNWNALTYAPLPPKMFSFRTAAHGIVYYGSYRQHREPYFTRFFHDIAAHLSKRGGFTVASAAGTKFSDRYPGIVVTPGIPQESFIYALAGYAAGLYIEDPKSHEQFHSPANRFYEMLSAGLPTMFQVEAVPRLAEAGYDVRPFVVETAADVKRFMQRRCEIGERQWSLWSRRARADFAGLTVAASEAHKLLWKRR